MSRSSKYVLWAGHAMTCGAVGRLSKDVFWVSNTRMDRLTHNSIREKIVKIFKWVLEISGYKGLSEKFMNPSTFVSFSPFTSSSSSFSLLPPHLSSLSFLLIFLLSFLLIFLNAPSYSSSSSSSSSTFTWDGSKWKMRGQRSTWVNQVLLRHGTMLLFLEEGPRVH